MRTGTNKPAVPRRPRLLLVAAALGALTLVAYSNSFSAGFVFDNKVLLLQDPRIREATAENLGLIFQHTYWWPYGESGLYRPVGTLSYLFNYAVLGNGQHPEGYHWINLFLHFGNVLLVYALARRLLRGRFGDDFWPPLFVAALWAVHPVLTESVTNIIGRVDLLAAMAVLSGLVFYLKSTEASGTRRWMWLGALAAVTFVGVFSKENAVVILGVIVLYEVVWWKERRNMRGLLLGCAAVALPLLALWFARSVVIAGQSAVSFRGQSAGGGRFLDGAAYRPEGAGAVSGSASLACESFGGLFLRRDSAGPRHRLRLDRLDERGSGGRGDPSIPAQSSDRVCSRICGAGFAADGELAFSHRHHHGRAVSVLARNRGGDLHCHGALRSARQGCAHHFVSDHGSVRGSHLGA